MGELKEGATLENINEWDVKVDPTRILARSVVATGAYKTYAPDVLDKICKMELQENDIYQPTAHKIVKPIMKAAFSQSGKFTGTEDQIIVYRLFLFTIAYLLELEPEDKAHLGKKKTEAFSENEKLLTPIKSSPEKKSRSWFKMKRRFFQLFQ